jgi:hypothetical protein
MRKSHGSLAPDVVRIEEMPSGKHDGESSGGNRCEVVSSELSQSSSLLGARRQHTLGPSISFSRSKGTNKNIYISISSGHKMNFTTSPSSCSSFRAHPHQIYDIPIRCESTQPSHLPVLCTSHPMLCISRDEYYTTLAYFVLCTMYSKSGISSCYFAYNDIG